MITAIIILVPLCMVTAFVEWAITLPEKMETRRYAHFLRAKCRKDYGW